jgi:hypothetical protein
MRLAKKRSSFLAPALYRPYTRPISAIYPLYVGMEKLWDKYQARIAQVWHGCQSTQRKRNAFNAKGRTTANSSPSTNPDQAQSHTQQPVNPVDQRRHGWARELTRYRRPLNLPEFLGTIIKVGGLCLHSSHVMLINSAVGSSPALCSVRCRRSQ